MYAYIYIYVYIHIHVVSYCNTYQRRRLFPRAQSALLFSVVAVGLLLYTQSKPVFMFFVIVRLYTFPTLPFV